MKINTTNCYSQTSSDGSTTKRPQRGGQGDKSGDDQGSNCSGRSSSASPHHNGTQVGGPNSSSGQSAKVSDCGALNLVVHKRRPPPILEESDQTVPNCPTNSTATASSSKSENHEENGKPEKTIKTEVSERCPTLAVWLLNWNWIGESLFWILVDLSSTSVWRVGFSLSGDTTIAWTMSAKSWISNRC